MGPNYRLVKAKHVIREQHEEPYANKFKKQMDKFLEKCHLL